MHTLPIFCNISVISLLCPPGFTDDCLAAILRHPSVKILRLQGGFSWRHRSSMVTDAGFINAVNSGCAANLARTVVQLEMTHWGLTDRIATCLGQFRRLEHLDISFTDVGKACFDSAAACMPRLSCLVLVACDFLHLCNFHLLKRDQSRLNHLDLRASGYAASDEDRKNI